jgi:uncharacterized protein
LGVSSTAPAAPAPPAARVQERLGSLDILRGFALLGMILVHVHQKLEQPATSLEDLISWFIWVGVEQKSWATFAFLFGVGFAIQLRRMEAKGASVTRLYLRRLLVLGVFGVLAHALFGFRILLEYAVWGVPLLLIRRWSTRSLLLAALVSTCALSLIEITAGAHEWVTLGRQGADAAAEARSAAPNPVRTALKAAEAQPSYPVLVAARLQAMRADYLSWSFLIPGANLTLFILGFLALRHGLIDAPRKHVKMIAVWMTLGFLSWAVWWLVLREAGIELVPLRISNQLRQALGIVSEQWLAFTYIGGFLLLLAYRPVWEQRLQALGWAGRMALTNYLFQIAVLDVLSSGYGVPLKIRPALVPLLAALIFGAEIAFSRIWLTRYRLGPAEWLWRSLTYGKAQPMRRAIG